jgi:hypothetical protein
LVYPALPLFACVGERARCEDYVQLHFDLP